MLGSAQNESMCSRCLTLNLQLKNPISESSHTEARLAQRAVNHTTVGRVLNIQSVSMETSLLNKDQNQVWF